MKQLRHILAIGGALLVPFGKPKHVFSSDELAGARHSRPSFEPFQANLLDFHRLSTTRDAVSMPWNWI